MSQATTPKALAGRTSAVVPPACPYKGLLPYDEDDAAFFFGREDERDVIVANLMAARLTLLYGPSGVGKSSILRAGVARHLRGLADEEFAERGRRDFVVAAFSDWRDDPVAGLTARIEECLGQAFPDAGLEAAPKRLAERLRAWTQQLGIELYLLLDQFEEYFLYHGDEDGEGTFAVEFPRILALPDVRVNVLIAIREDALAKLDRFEGRVPNLFDNILRLQHLDRDAARVAIEEPVQQFNRLVGPEQQVQIEPELVEALLEQVKTGRVLVGQSGLGMVEGTDESVADGHVETPYLQLVMTRLWTEEMAARSGSLRLATLTRLGGAQRIVRTHLDEAMGSLPAEEQEVAARVFHHLVTPSGTKIAHTAADLSAYAQVPEASLDRVLEELSGGVRILRPVAPPSNAADGYRYEIFHDVLAAAILDWRGRYVQAQERAATERQHAEELEVEAGKKREARELARTERRRARIARAAASALALLLAITVALAVVAVQSTRNAESKALLAQAMQQLHLDPAEATRLSLAALARNPGREAEEALRRSMSKSFGRAVMQGHTGPVNTSVFSPDGKLVLTAGKDGTARIWEVPTGRAVRVLLGHRGELLGAVFSRDGALVLTWGRDKTVRVWQAASGGQLAVLGGHKDWQAGAAFSPDARHVLTWGLFDRARVWDWRKRVTLASLDAGKVQGAAFSPDGRRIVTADSDHRLRVWTWRTQQPPIVSNKVDDPVYLPTFSPDGATIVAADFFSNVTAWRWQTTKEPTAIYTKIYRDVYSVEVSRDGKRLVAAGDKVAEVYDLPSGDRIAELKGHTDWVNKATFSPDGNLVATVSSDGTARIWEVAAERPLVELLGHDGLVADAAFSPDGTLVATAGTDGTARTWAVPTGLALRGTDDWVLDARFSSDGRFVATAGGDGTARVYDAATGRQLALTDDFAFADGYLHSVAFSPHGDLIVVAGQYDAAPHLWHWRGGTKAPSLDPPKSTDGDSAPKYVHGVAFSPDGKRVVAGASDGTARIWDAVTGRQVGVLQGPNDEDVWSAEFSPDGRSVVTASSDGTARIWDATTSQQRQVLRGHNGAVSTARYSHDGAFIVTASWDRTVWVWDAATGRPLRTLTGQRSRLSGASFSPDGRLVVAGGADSTTEVWEWRTGTVLAVLHQHADSINDTSFSPDGRLVLTASDDHTAKLYPCDLCGPLATVRELATERQRSLHGQ